MFANTENFNQDISS
ncbi:hypothetical protein JIY74_30060 [Vibrio harveyi]|nr:hypothetical protein [Vibrio harveyi]